MVSKRRFHARAVLSMLALLTACASAPPDGREPQPFSLGLSRQPIGSQELQATGLGTTYDALRRIRPEFFLRRTSSMLSDPYRGYPVVYLDGQLQGSLDLLNTIPINAIRSIHYLTGTQANAHLGKYHPGGVIAVHTRR